MTRDQIITAVERGTDNEKRRLAEAKIGFALVYAYGSIPDDVAQYMTSIRSDIVDSLMQEAEEKT